MWLTKRGNKDIVTAFIYFKDKKLRKTKNAFC